MQVKDLSIDEFKALIRETVEEVLQELIVDPDQVRSIRSNVVAELQQIHRVRAEGRPTISSDEAMRQLDLD
jgi:hypothetical protein